MDTNRLLKNTHLLCYAHPSSLQRITQYASFLRMLRALHLDVFDQPEKNYFFNDLLKPPCGKTHCDPVQVSLPDSFHLIRKSTSTKAPRPKRYQTKGVKSFFCR
jgi:hypothetical protein